jgi:type VI secretion system secreted protein Hcp
MRAFQWLLVSTIVVALVAGPALAQVGRATTLPPRVQVAPTGGASPGQVHFAQTQFTFTVKGAKQGVFKGEAGAPPGHLNGLAMEYGAKAPVAADGMVTGKLQHQPVVITRPAGAASVQLFSAFTSHESLPEVVIKVQALTVPNGSAEHWITLTNATIIGFRLFTGTFSEYATPLLFEEVTLRFQKITIGHPAGPTSTTDW